MKYIAVYYRVSTDRQDLKLQQNAFAEFVATLPSDVEVTVYDDQARSGADSSRPGFIRLMAACRARRHDTLVAYSLDRLSRKSTEALRLVLDLDDCGVVFHSLSQPVLNLGPDMPFRKMILAMFAEIAQIERDTTIKRVKAGIAAARARGQQIGKPTKLTRGMHADILRMRSDGLGARKIAEHFGVGHSLVQRAFQHNLDHIQYAG